MRNYMPIGQEDQFVCQGKYPVCIGKKCAVYCTRQEGFATYTEGHGWIPPRPVWNVTPSTHGYCGLVKQ